jgi:hypothetical protein
MSAFGIHLIPRIFSGPDSEPDHYVLMAVAFGDRPSGAIATLALRQTMYQHNVFV